MQYENNAFEDFVQNLTISEKMALYVTQYVGTMGFVYILMFLIFSWIIFNLIFSHPFDSKDFFILFSIIAVIDFLLMPFILVGQNLISKFNEEKERADFDRNKNIEFHLLKMEAMLNRMLPDSEKRSIQMHKGIENIDDTVDIISDKIKYGMEKELNNGSKDVDVLIQVCTGGMELNSIALLFFPKAENIIVSVLNEIRDSWDIVILPTSLSIEGKTTMTFLYNPKDQNNILDFIKRKLESYNLSFSRVEI